MSVEREKVQKGLLKKGFVETPGKKHIFYNFYHKGKKTRIKTCVSRGSKYKTLGDPLVASMAEQCKLNARLFRELVECSVSHEDYVEILKGAGQV